MDGHNSPEPGMITRLSGVSGSAWRGVLLLLLALSVCIGYFYFFTDFLQSKKEIPGQAGVYPSEVKKPLPARPGQTVTPPPDRTSQVSAVSPGSVAKPSVSPAETKSAAPQGNKAEPVPVQKKQTTAPAAVKTPTKVTPIQTKPVKGTAASTSAVSAKPASPAVKPVHTDIKQTAKPVVGTTKSAPPVDKKKAATARQANAPVKVMPVPTKIEAANNGKGDAAKTAQTGKSNSPGSKAAAQQAQKSPDNAKSKPKSAPSKEPAFKSVKAAPGQEPATPRQDGDSYTLVVGNYVMKSTMQHDKARIEKAGLTASVTSGKKKSEPMNRLMVSQHDSYALAKPELEKIKKSGGGAFIVQEEGKYSVYAGSYFQYDRAVEERERLQKLGVNSVIKKSDVSVSTYALTSGSFPTRDAAVEGAARLKKLGFKPYPVAIKKKQIN